MEKCHLPEDINSCPYYSNGNCTNTDECSYKEKRGKMAAQPKKYVRQPRWYEKYYERKKGK